MTLLEFGPRPARRTIQLGRPPLSERRGWVAFYERHRCEDACSGCGVQPRSGLLWPPRRTLVERRKPQPRRRVQRTKLQISNLKTTLQKPSRKGLCFWVLISPCRAFPFAGPSTALRPDSLGFAPCSSLQHGPGRAIGVLSALEQASSRSDVTTRRNVEGGGCRREDCTQVSVSSGTVVRSKEVVCCSGTSAQSQST